MDGGCLCGAVRYSITAEPIDSAHCHCRICQRSAGAAFLTWATLPASGFAYTHGTALAYRSSDKAVREFCEACGTQLVFRADDGGTIDVTIASLDAPDGVKIDGNIWTGSRRAWCHGFDADLPDHPGEMPGG
jgi:hypothetical protein